MKIDELGDKLINLLLDIDFIQVNYKSMTESGISVFDMNYTTEDTKLKIDIKGNTEDMENINSIFKEIANLRENK